MTPSALLRGAAAARCEAPPLRRCVTPHASPPCRSAHAAARHARCSPLCAAAPRRPHAQQAAAGADAPPQPPPAASSAHPLAAAAAIAASSASPPPPRATPFLADLLVSCPDQKGVVAALAQLLFGYGCNILSSDQHSDDATNTYFQRIHVDYSDLIVGAENVNVLENAMKHTASRFDMTWSIHYHTKCARAHARARCAQSPIRHRLGASQGQHGAAARARARGAVRAPRRVVARRTRFRRAPRAHAHTHTRTHVRSSPMPPLALTQRILVLVASPNTPCALPTPPRAG
jgi:hypothetical protein